ncbi:hypothetical protein K7X08_028349 [Anisodus acutangulus]|uniref:dolichol kinase n=1 Tax=Anisodus acutangulus TaxID=402998 RepID=A0A9Q1REB9_9SOLA|nr:hypothetical protein K7X08_028349 [Anisodus acutangulus]
MALSLFLNDERAVVALFIARIVFSVPQSLMFESLSLSLLSLLALFVEIAVDQLFPNSISKRFKIRPGASSGIFLGVVTLPGLMVSKLIQIARALEKLQLLYWVASASCFGVLVYLYSIIFPRQQFVAEHCLTICSLVGWYTPLILVWILCHGFAAVKLIQNALHSFPACASIGEALLVSVGLVIYLGDMFACTAANDHGYLTTSKIVSVPYGIRKSEISIIIQGVIIGFLLFPLLFKYVLQLWEWFNNSRSSRDGSEDHMKRSFLFYASLACVLVMAIPLWMQFVQDFQRQPYLWLSLCIYWLVVIYASVIRFYSISKSKISVCLWHIWKIWPLGQLVHWFLNAFTDHRDSDLLIVSHFSLLLGCALPIWLSSGFNDRPLAPFAGILSLGIGDTMFFAGAKLASKQLKALLLA